LNHIPHANLFEDPEKKYYVQAAMVGSHQRHLYQGIPVYHSKFQIKVFFGLD
jgi:hypothetical protein